MSCAVSGVDVERTRTELIRTSTVRRRSVSTRCHTASTASTAVTRRRSAAVHRLAASEISITRAPLSGRREAVTARPAPTPPRWKCAASAPLLAAASATRTCNTPAAVSWRFQASGRHHVPSTELPGRMDDTTRSTISTTCLWSIPRTTAQWCLRRETATRCRRSTTSSTAWYSASTKVQHRRHGLTTMIQTQHRFRKYKSFVHSETHCYYFIIIYYYYYFIPLAV